MKKPNIIIVGEVETMEPDGDPHKIEYGIVIECSDPSQIREAIKKGSIDFSVFES